MFCCLARWRRIGKETYTMSISSHSQQIYQVVMGATKFDVDAIIVVLKQVLNITKLIESDISKFIQRYNSYDIEFFNFYLFVLARQVFD